jgi:glucosyl-3-phosphoglycerate synthase
VDDAARAWFAAATTSHTDWDPARLAQLKASTANSVSVVVPARNEAATIGPLLDGIREHLMGDLNLVDELVVMDSLSSDETGAVARAHGATVWSVADVRPDLGVYAGKGEALWKSQFVTSGDLLVFIDADLTEWGPHFVWGLLGPLITNPGTLLVKGFYDRPLDDEPEVLGLQGGRVTELVARPLLGLFWPQLAATVQPLAGEWAIRRSLFGSLHVPEGYGVEFSTLVDTWQRYGLDAIAQVDLGRRAHRHQSVHDLGVMAAEILQVADARRGHSVFSKAETLAEASAEVSAAVSLEQFDRHVEGGWRARPVPVRARPPVLDVGSDPESAPC